MTENIASPFYSWPWWKRAWMRTHRPTRRAERMFRHFPQHLPIRTVMDVGAYDGSFTQSALHYYPLTHAWLIEANPTRIPLLETDFKTNPRCTLIHRAVADRNTTLSFSINQHAASSSLLPLSPNSEELVGERLSVQKEVSVPASSLDSLFSEFQIQNVDLMKVDIQGAERLLIAGGQSALRKTNILFIEVMFEKQYEGCALFGELHDSLLSLGFHLQSLHKLRRGPAGFIVYGDAIYIRTPSAPERQS